MYDLMEYARYIFGSPIKVMMLEIKIFNARFAREKKGNVVQISGEARNLNHLTSFF
jgi:hypothetical protein